MAEFLREPANQGEDILVVTEMTLRHLQEGEALSHRDFLDRVDLLRTLGKPVMISNLGEYYRLANYLHRYTAKLTGLVMGVPTLREIFDERYYTHLAGGILESFGRMFKNDLKLYVYPIRDSDSKAVVTADDLRFAPKLQPLYNYLIENEYIQPICGYKSEYMSTFNLSRDVFRRLQEGDPTWVDDVPANVALLICQRHLLGYDPEKCEQITRAPA